MNEEISPSSKADVDQWLTLDSFIQAHPNFKRSQIEWLYRNRENNGYLPAFKKVGRSRYIHAGIFSDCIHNS